MTQLMTLWKKAVQGERSVVLIQGAAGEGKSRLVHALIRSATSKIVLCGLRVTRLLLKSQ